MSNPKSLSDEQVAQIRAWAESGDGLAEIQKKLRTEMGLSVTYLETRFLLEDLAVELLPTPAPEPEKAPPGEEGADFGDSPDGEGAGSADALKPEGVKVSLDQVLRPGALLSGKADFGGGKVVSWWLDQMGRLGMDGGDPDFRPTEEQARSFQMELSRLVQQSGF